MKTIKRLLAGNTGPGGALTDRFHKALLQYRNSPDPETRMSPTVCLFGRPTRDLLPGIPDRYRPHTEWSDRLNLRERALSKRSMSNRTRWDEHSQGLTPLKCGDSVMVQNQTGCHPNKWDKTGTVVEVLQYHQYADGSGRLTTRNRRFLRWYNPIPSSPPTTTPSFPLQEPPPSPSTPTRPPPTTPPPPPMPTPAPITAESNPHHPIPSQTTPTHLGTPLPPGPSDSLTPPPFPHTPLPSGSPGPPLPTSPPRSSPRSYASVAGTPHTPRIATSAPHRPATPRTLLPTPATPAPLRRSMRGPKPVLRYGQSNNQVDTSYQLGGGSGY